MPSAGGRSVRVCVCTMEQWVTGLNGGGGRGRPQEKERPGKVVQADVQEQSVLARGSS